MHGEVRKAITDHPELAGLKVTTKIRNYSFHRFPFKEKFIVDDDEANTAAISNFILQLQIKIKPQTGVLMIQMI